MGFNWKLRAAVVLLAAPSVGLAATCTTQSAMSADDRGALSAEVLLLAGNIAQQNYSMLQSALVPSQTGSWDGILSTAQMASPLLAQGQIQVHNLYLLDVSNLTAPADAEFFCSDQSGSINVTIDLSALPPGKYALALAKAQGSPLAGQLGIILAWNKPSNAWLLAGLFAHQGIFDGHDGLWYWTRARSLLRADPWTAFYSYIAARFLLVPVDFLSSPNLEKLSHEQEQISPSPVNAFPLSLKQGDRTWKIVGVMLDPSLHEPDLGIAYESTGVTDPAALRTEATSVMSALLQFQPGLRANFHGLWAYAVVAGKSSPVMELPMAQIP